MYKDSLKRAFDLVISILVMPIFIFISLMIGLLIKREDKGPVFYKSKRLGKDKKIFSIYKFRSMKVNAPDIRNEDGSTFNAENDPRITNIGKLIRKTSIDELPQLLNVLKGDMSFVGPRPSPLGNEAHYPDYYKEKFHVKPGITGLTQALLRNSASMEERMRLDAFYAQNVGFKMDAFIIYKTIATVLLQKNINQK